MAEMKGVKTRKKGVGLAMGEVSMDEGMDGGM